MSEAKLPVKSWLAYIAALFVALFISFMIFPSANTHAYVGSAGDGSGGSGGAGSDCSDLNNPGCAFTRKNWGWYEYDIATDAGPTRFSDGRGSWSGMKSACRADGADKVVAFVILERYSSNPNRDGVVYNYEYKYNGNRNQQTTGDWMTISAAKGLYDSLPASDKVGYTWGSNVGWFCYDTDPGWELQTLSFVSGTAAEGDYGGLDGAGRTITGRPGQTVYFKHRVKNIGSNTASYTRIHQQDYNAPRYTNQSSNAASLAGGDEKDYPGTAAAKRYNIPANAPHNALYCERYVVSPRSSDSTANRASAGACVRVVRPYTLSPGVNLNPSEITEAGAEITINAYVDNNGTNARTSDPMEAWQISYITMDSGVTPPGPVNRGANTTPCDYYESRPGVLTCDPGDFDQGESTGGGQTVEVPGRTFQPRVDTVEDLPVGRQVCYALSVRDRSSSSTQWRHSGVTCVTVAKRPLTQVIGGDLIVGRVSVGSMDVGTSVRTFDDTQHGSWAEYGISASGLISGMASASGFAGGKTPAIEPFDMCPVSYLSFSNRAGGTNCSSGQIGNYTFRAASATIASRFPESSATTISGNVNVNSLASDRVYTGDGTISLRAPSGYRMEAEKWVVINAPDATVRIMNDLRYTDEALDSIAQIPQLIIIAQNIIISDDVSQIDAWLVATGSGTDGRINTCGASTVGVGINEATPLRANRCAARLTVNGPVIANHLVLRRTAGAGTGSGAGNPAEIFNLRPDAYLWAANLQTEGAKAQTVITTELPPRY